MNGKSINNKPTVIGAPNMMPLENNSLQTTLASKGLRSRPKKLHTSKKLMYEKVVKTVDEFKKINGALKGDAAYKNKFKMVQVSQM